VDTRTDHSVRIVPRSTVRNAARAYAPQANNQWEAQLVGYQRMPSAELFDCQVVELTRSVQELIGRRRKAICEHCGEEIMNEREVVRDGLVLCRACAGPAYYRLRFQFSVVPIEETGKIRTT
jgi:formylmethanofuran dehydrogenase subunit E